MPGLVAIPHLMLVREEATTLEEEEIPVSAAGKVSVDEDGKVCVPLILQDRIDVRETALQTASYKILHFPQKRSTWLYNDTYILAQGTRLATARGVTAWAMLSGSHGYV
jgi:hypothetical protein